ncbi:Hypothetical predicted protein [Pelobates cultripes]|uniref:Uncharacterized protein n=1 Tax=Pelobates cultripes TaxID=61616 RepID=A0AAD1VYC6_PELCU|nr:Hypothetical predicted protein [Pelobates cultripes]
MEVLPTAAPLCQQTTSREVAIWDLYIMSRRRGQRCECRKRHGQRLAGATERVPVTAGQSAIWSE